MSTEAIDLNDVLERVQGDRELLVELFDIYVPDSEGKIKGLNEAVKNKEYEKIKSLAHSLKGASGNISAKKLQASFLKIEELGKTQDLSNAWEILSEIENQFFEVKAYITKFKTEANK